MMNRRIITIDANNFSTLEAFYDEIDRVLTKDLDWKTGHNLNAFNDLLRGGFGVHEYEEPIILKWSNIEKSKQDFDTETFERIIEIIKEHDHIEFYEE